MMAAAKAAKWPPDIVAGCARLWGWLVPTGEVVMEVPTNEGSVVTVAQHYGAVQKTLRQIALVLQRQAHPLDVKLLLNVLQIQLKHIAHLTARHQDVRQLRAASPAMEELMSHEEKEFPQLLDELQRLWRAADALEAAPIHDVSTLQDSFTKFAANLQKLEQREINLTKNPLQPE